jgi:hypothetical protein
MPQLEKAAVVASDGRARELQFHPPSPGMPVHRTRLLVMVIDLLGDESEQMRGDDTHIPAVLFMDRLIPTIWQPRFGNRLS